MRKVVTALMLIAVAGSLVACSSSGTDQTTTQATPPVAATPAASVAATGAAAADIYSPTQTVAPNQAFPTDAASVPQAVLNDLNAKQPLMLFWYDSTTKVATDQRTEIDAALKKYKGQVALVAIDYTTGLPTDVAGSTLAVELQKTEIMTGLLKVNTTPYIMLVDRYGRISYRFAGFTDRTLIEREVLRATQ